MRRPRNPQNTIVLLIFIIIILILALALSVMANFSLLPKAAGDPVQATTEPPGLAVDGELIMARAADFGVSIEFLQLILPGYLVYQDGGAYVYQPLDPELPLHDYLWRRLYHGAGGRTYYQDERYPDITYGVDVSTYQGEIDWQAAATDGVDFAMIRLGYRGYSQGSLFQDDQAEKNLEGAAAAGLPIGAYFFSQAVTVAEAEEEAQMALAILDGRELAYPVVCDMEEISNEASRIDSLSIAERTQVIKAFCQAIEDGGYQAMIYGNIRWLAGRIDLAELKDYPLWLGQYYSRPLFPYDFAIWQYTDSAAVAGIEKPVDLNICFKQSWLD